MKLKEALGGGLAGGLGVGAVLAFGTVAIGVVALPFAGAYFAATALGAAYGTLAGVGGAVVGFIGGSMVAGAAAAPAFYGVLAVTTAVGAVIGGVVGLASKAVDLAVSPFKRKSAVKAAPKKKAAKVQAPTSNDDAPSKIADKAVKPEFDAAKKPASEAQKQKKPAPKPSSAPKA